MSERLKRFQGFESHQMHGRMMKRLSAEERRLCEEFILENEALDSNAFAVKVNRWYLDAPVKPKRVVDMWALVLQSNR